MRAPMPRAGKLTTRRKLVSSFGFSIRRRYESACLTSARSKKRRPAVDLVRDVRVEERALHHPALRVAAVEQRDLVTRRAVAVQRLRLLDEPLRLGEIARRLVHAHRLARPGLGAQVLAEAARVARDQLVGGVEDVAERAVVALELDHRAHPVLALEERPCCRPARRERRRCSGRRRRRRTGRSRARAARRTSSARRTGAGWCPGTRRPGCGESAADSARAAARCRASARSVRSISSAKSTTPSRWHCAS